MTKPVTPTARPRSFIYPPHPDPDHDGHPRRGPKPTAPPGPAFDVGGAPYRLARKYKNIALQRLQPGGRWLTVAHCGNNPRSVIRAVTELALVDWSPDLAADLGQQMASLRRAIDQLETTILESLKNGLCP